MVLSSERSNKDVQYFICIVIIRHFTILLHTEILHKWASLDFTYFHISAENLHLYAHFNQDESILHYIRTLFYFPSTSWVMMRSDGWLVDPFALRQKNRKKGEEWPESLALSHRTLVHCFCGNQQNDSIFYPRKVYSIYMCSYMFSGRSIVVSWPTGKDRVS